MEKFSLSNTCGSQGFEAVFSSLCVRWQTPKLLLRLKTDDYI